MQRLTNSPAPPETCSCALSGADRPQPRPCLVDKMSAFVLGKRLCDITGWVVVALLPLLLFEVYGSMRFTCHGGNHTKTAQNDMSTLAQVSERYKLEHGQWPDSCEQLLAAGLVRKCTLDPWGTEYQLFVVHDGRPSLGLRSAGRDRVHGTSDDVLPYWLE